MSVLDPNSPQGRAVAKAWREGRVIPMNAAARNNMFRAGLTPPSEPEVRKMMRDTFGIDMNSLPSGLRPGTKVGKRRKPSRLLP